MRNYLLAAITAVGLLATWTGDTLAQSSNDGMHRWIAIHNESDIPAIRIHTIPSGKDCCWSRDLLEHYVILKNERLFVNFDDGSGECRFDIHIVSRIGSPDARLVFRTQGCL